MVLKNTIIFLLIIILTGCRKGNQEIEDGKVGGTSVVAQNKNRIQTQRAGTRSAPTIWVKGIPVKIEISDTPEKRMKGLMGRERLEWDSGMLFVFEYEQHLSFWMRNTRIPLSIAFIDQSGIIVDMVDMAPYDTSSYVSKHSAIYTLEMNCGWFEKNKVRIGDKVSFR